MQQLIDVLEDVELITLYKPTVRYSRKIDEKVLELISEKTIKLELTELNNIQDLNERDKQFGKLITDIIDEVAPLKKCKQRKLANLPWYDRELQKLELKTSKLFEKHKKKPACIIINRY